MDQRLNVAYWNSLYPVYTDYDEEQYRKAMGKPRVVKKAEHLWGWKGLNRSVPFEQIAPVIEDLKFDKFTKRDSQQAVELLSDHLSEDGIIGPNSLVTPAFLLHLAASSADRYSTKFPIYDRRVWNAFVYLKGIRSRGERLYSAASSTPSQYQKFCNWFNRTSPDEIPREYERALFMFGGFILAIPPKDERTPIEEIDALLKSQEEALANMKNKAAFALIDNRE